MARRVLISLGMKPHDKDPNQGEGDKVSAREYNRQAQDFVADGKVEEAARDAARFVDEEPGEAKRAEQRAKRGPGSTKVSVDELIAKGRTVIDRVRPMVERVVDRVKSRLNK
ncbi:hypothetical protein BH11MYX3_BH11MYX3_04300 [soil metagenome]